MLPDFELGHLEMKELADSEPLIAAASARIAIGNEDFLVRLCAGDVGPERLFFRLEAPGSPVFKIPHLSVAPVRKMANLLNQGDEQLSSLFEDISFTIWQQELPDLFQEVLSEENWQRNLILAYPTSTSPVQVCFNGRGGMWFVDPHYPVNKSSIFLSPEGKNLGLEDLKMVSDEELSHQILGWLENSSSDCAFAYNWSQHSLDERTSAAIEFKQGTWAEFVRVLQLLITNEDGVWKDNKTDVSWGVNFFLKSNSNSHSQAIRRAKQYELEVDLEIISISNRLQRGLDILHSYFAPVVSSAAGNTSIFRKYHRTSLAYSFPLKFPSFHERLEARLQLRDWLQGKVAPEEIPRLLGERE